MTLRTGFGLIALVSTVMAIAGASSAQAVVDNETVWCSENNVLCPTAKKLPQGAHITFLSTNPALLGTINETCGHSKKLTEIVSPGGMGDPLVRRVISRTLSSCEPCTAVTASSGEGTIDTSEAGDWVLTSPDAITLEGCPFGVKCKFEGTVKLLGKNGASGAEFIATKAAMKLTGGNSKVFCGSEAFWDATYVAAEHWLSTYQLP